MLLDDFWDLIELARSDADVVNGRFAVDGFAAALCSRLAALPGEQIIEFFYRYHEVRDRLHQWELSAAAYLICGYISDNVLENFQAGVIALGRAAFHQIAEDPDQLSESPVVIDIAAGRLERHALCSEEIHLATAYAYAALNDGDHDAFWQALDDRPAISAPHPTAPASWDGRFGEPGDRDLMPVRLPRLAAMFDEAVYR